MDRDNLKQRIAQKLLSDHIDALQYPQSWPTVINALGNASDGLRSALIESFKNGNPNQVFASFGRIMRRELRSLAESEAETILADDSISREELKRILS